MSMEITKTTLEGFFYTSWVATPIQYQGVPFSGAGVTKWVSLKYVPVMNELYAFDGTGGRIEYNSQLQVFCYDTSPTKSIKLADAVCTFLNNKSFSPDIVVDVGFVQGSALDLENGIFETMLIFEVNNYA